MTELKTRKEFLYGCKDYPNCNKKCEQFDYKGELKEAIKWVKSDIWMKENPYGDCGMEAIGWIKHFFNITSEEDLK